MQQPVEQPPEKTLMDMAMGAIRERVDLEMGRVVDNILDPNTKATAKRSLTVTVGFIPDDDRRIIAMETLVKPGLANTNTIKSTLYVAADPKTGEVQVVEMTPQLPGQQSMFGKEQPQPVQLKLLRGDAA